MRQWNAFLPLLYMGCSATTATEDASLDPTGTPPVVTVDSTAADSEPYSTTVPTPIYTIPGPNPAPPDWLLVQQEGSWDLEPGSPPYATLTGSLALLEILESTYVPPVSTSTSGSGSSASADTGTTTTGTTTSGTSSSTSTSTSDSGPAGPPCNVEYALTGVIVDDTTCANCLLVADVTHTVVSGDPDGCRAPDVPQDLDVWRLGFRDDELFLKYPGGTTWIAWYDASSTPGHVDFSWATRLGFDPEENE